MTTHKKKHVSFDDLDTFEINASNFIIDAANKSIKKNGIFKIVLCGGSTPKRIYGKLQEQKTDWSKWIIFLGDERCLPENHKDRNSMMIKNNFCNNVPIPSNQIFLIESEIGNVAAANKYNLLLDKEENFDLVLLGFGEDGHTASLFPGHEWDDSANVIAIFDAPKPPADRVSMTASRLSKTDKILYLVSGSNKSNAFQRWNDKNDLPVSKISAKDELVIYSFDI